MFLNYVIVTIFFYLGGFALYAFCQHRASQIRDKVSLGRYGGLNQ